MIFHFDKCLFFKWVVETAKKWEAGLFFLNIISVFLIRILPLAIIVKSPFEGIGYDRV